MSEMRSELHVPVWTVGDRLDKALRDARVSHNEMAEYLGVTRNTVGNYIAGRTTPNDGVLRLWSFRCGVPMEWLRHGTSDGASAAAEAVIKSSFSSPFSGVSRAA